MKKNLVDFQIGADPEFALIDATEYGDYSYGSTGDDFGLDGGGDVYEVRPNPSKEPEDLVLDIRDIFLRRASKTPQILSYNWLAVSDSNGFCMGGHIHYSLNNNKINHLVAAGILDNYLGSLSLLLENKNRGFARRKSGEYGFMGDFRKNNHGFEYRVLSTWLSSPYVSLSILCLAKTIIFEVLNNKDFSPNNYVENYDFTDMNTTKVRKVFPNIWDEIKKMHLYQKYKLNIDLIYYLITNNLTWHTNDMKESWGLVNLGKMDKNKIQLNSIWSKYQNT